MVMVMVMVMMCEACLHAGSSEDTLAVAGVAPTIATADIAAAAAVAVAMLLWAQRVWSMIRPCGQQRASPPLPSRCPRPGEALPTLE